MMGRMDCDRDSSGLLCIIAQVVWYKKHERELKSCPHSTFHAKYWPNTASSEESEPFLNWLAQRQCLFPNFHKDAICASSSPGEYQASVGGTNLIPQLQWIRNITALYKSELIPF